MTLEEEARIYANLKKGFDMEEELHYNSGAMKAYKSFQAGANSKWVQAEKIKAQIEIIRKCMREDNTWGNVDELQKQLKQLEDEKE